MDAVVSRKGLFHEYFLAKATRTVSLRLSQSTVLWPSRQAVPIQCGWDANGCILIFIVFIVASGQLHHESSFP
jgi:hypothetical protein